MAGGKRMSFRACVIVGDKKGRIGMGVKKGADVQLAVQKATNYAKKRLIQVPIVEGSIPHTVEYRSKGAIVLLKPAKEGTGLIAGGAVRVALEMAGVQNIVSKMKGSNNKINNLAAVIEALGSLSTKDAMKKQLKDTQAE
jgi:small subunit ribosomal protein S5